MPRGALKIGLLAVVIFAAGGITGYDRTLPKEVGTGLSNDGKDVVYNLKVLVANDPKFSPITEEDAVETLAAAAETIGRRYPGAKIKFEVADIRSVEEVFIDYDLVEQNEATWHLDISSNFRHINTKRWRKHLPFVLDFLRKKTISQLKELLNTKQKQRIEAAKNKYLEYAKLLFETQLKRIEQYRQLKIPGRDTFLLEDRPYQLQRYWLQLGRKQKDYDLFLTNTFVLLDSIAVPHPHAVLHKNKIGGQVLYSSVHTRLDGVATYASMFELYNGPAIFKDKDLPATLTRSERNKVIGTVLVAHELAHALFNLPDYYDHPEHCILNVNKKTNPYYAAYQVYTGTPKPCAKCRLYVEPRLRALQSYIDYRTGNYQAALKNSKAGRKMAPSLWEGQLDFSHKILHRLQVLSRKALNKQNQAAGKSGAGSK